LQDLWLEKKQAILEYGSVVVVFFIETISQAGAFSSKS
jgi:hypothetical protein